MNIPAVVRYALFASAIVIGTKLLVFYTHSQTLYPWGVFSGLISLVLMAVPIYLAAQDKKASLGGYITLKQVMSTGLAIAIISGFLIAVFTYLYFYFIDHETADMVITRRVESMQKENRPKGEIDLEVDNIRAFYAPFKQATGVLSGVLISCLILSFICSSFIVRNPPAES